MFDILEEVSRQVNSLKRQASKAKRYEELQSRDGRATCACVLAGRFRMLEREAAKAALDLNQAPTELRTLSDEVTANEAGARAPAERLLRDGSAR